MPLRLQCANGSLGIFLKYSMSDQDLQFKISRKPAGDAGAMDLRTTLWETLTSVTHLNSPSYQGAETRFVPRSLWLQSLCSVLHPDHCGRFYRGSGPGKGPSKVAWDDNPPTPNRFNGWIGSFLMKAIHLFPNHVLSFLKTIGLYK